MSLFWFILFFAATQTGTLYRKKNQFPRFQHSTFLAAVARCNLNRPVGRTNISTRFSLLQDIGKIIPNVSKDGSFRSWGHVVKDELLWSMLINNIGSSKKFYYYNECYDDNDWNRRSEFPDPPASPAPNIGTNSNNNSLESPESPKSPPLYSACCSKKKSLIHKSVPINSRLLYF